MAKDATGWMPGVMQVRTQEYGYANIAEDQMFPRAVVSHVMQGYQRTMIDWARNNNGGKSAHFSVGRDGTIVQHVSIWDPAWHAGDLNTPVWPELSAIQGDTGHLNPNRFTVGIEHEGFSIVPSYGYDFVYSDANPWPEPLIEATIRIHQFVFASCVNWMKPGLETIITHSMLNSRSRGQDPGDLWFSKVRPRIVAALAPPSTGPRELTFDDGYAAGRAAALEAVRGWINELR